MSGLIHAEHTPRLEPRMFIVRYWRHDQQAWATSRRYRSEARARRHALDVAAQLDTDVIIDEVRIELASRRLVVRA